MWAMGEEPDEGVRPAELIAAISLATDIGMAQPLETGLAVCLVAVELAGRLGYGPDLRQRTFHLALLQHIGCTVASAPVAAVLGDEMVMRGHAATLDFTDQAAMFRFLLSHVGRVNPPLARPAALARAVARGKQVNGTMAGVCEGAIMLGERFGCGAESQRDIGCVYEYWDGQGLPHGLAGTEITEPACVVQVATLAVAAHHAGGTAAAVSLAGERSGHSLAPAAAAAFLADPGGLLARVETPASLWDAVLEAEPLPSPGPAGAGEVDRMLRAVADFVDLKSPVLAGHSSGVAALAETAAAGLGLPGDEVTTVRRAGWLHDIGRVGVSAAVWGHPGPLGAHQWEQVRLHPYHTSRVLDRSPYLRKLAAVAAAHHERQDGSGYFRGAVAAQLPAVARVLAAADVYHAMTEPRAHRPAHSPDAAAAEVREQAQAGRLDAAAVEAVLAAAGHRASRRRAAPAGLTPREVETLGLVARGLSIRQIARELTIAPKTADGHIQRIYAKTGVSTRAGATLFALSNDLVPPGAEDRENSP
jgi:HD-GYP domain-containing protein (c-di-GMP phosphodiesterase class II)